MTDYQIHTLQNGIRVVHKEVINTKVVHCGIMLDVGSRDESADQQGIAHFWEHMAFKGTRKRNAYHIINSLESVGGELNAYTTKEKICFYAAVLDRHIDKAFDVLSDITFRSTFPDKQIEKERGVILEEMALYYDSPEDAIQDEFDELIFEGHQLGRNILGNHKSVGSFVNRDFSRFVSENLNSHRIILTSVGNVPFKKIKRLAEKYLSGLPVFDNGKTRDSFSTYRQKERTISKPITQAHCAIGATAFPIGDDRRLPFFMLLNILGGPGMNSRLNLSLRENHGLVYSVEASYTPFIDTGSMGIFFGTQQEKVDKSIRLIMREIKKLREVRMGTMQLHKAKEQLMGQLAMSDENNNSIMLAMARSLLDLNRIQSLEEVFEQVRKVNGKELQEIANQSLQEKNLSILTFIPN